MKSIFITGGTSGIGEQLAKDFYNKGYRVAVCGRSKNKFDLAFERYKITYYQVDTTNKQDIENAIKEFSKHGLDIVIANAGRGYKSKTSVPNFDDCRDIISVNVLGVINTFEAAINNFLENKKEGQLVALSSLAAFNGLPGAPAYSASKSVVLKYCESLSLSLKSEKISVTCICPGFIKTPMTKVNKHPMPFLTDVTVASQKFIEAIESKKQLFIYPKIFGYFVYMLGKAPRFIFKFLVNRSKLNYTKN